MNEQDELTADFLNLRGRVANAQLATLASDGNPEASHAPCVWVDDRCHFFLSDLSGHTQNLRRDPAVGLVIVDHQDGNPFARKRITLRGKAQEIPRQDPASERVLAEFRRVFGEVMGLMEPLADFHVFRVDADGGSFIRGFGQAFRLGGERLDQLSHIDPRK